MTDITTSWLLFDTHNIRGDAMLLAYRNNIERKSQRVTDWDCIQLIRVRARELNKQWDDQVERLIHRWNNDYLPRVTKLDGSDTSILSSLVYKYTALTRNEQKTARALTAPHISAGGTASMMQLFLRKRIHKETQPEHMLLETKRLEEDKEDTGDTMAQFICTTEKIPQKGMGYKDNTACKYTTEDTLVQIMSEGMRTYRQTFDAVRYEYLYQRDKGGRK